MKASTDVTNNEPQDDTNTFYTRRIVSRRIYRAKILDDISMNGLPIFTDGQYSIPNKSNRSALQHEAVQMRLRQRQVTTMLLQVEVGYRQRSE